MNPWSSRRKTIIFFLTLFILFVLVGLPGYFLFKSEPDCRNGIQDGEENGVDCGGACELICSPDVLPLISRGDIRLLKIATSTYETVILIENPNTEGVVERARYSVTIYDNSSTDPVREFKRETFIGRNSTFALFEGPFTLEGEGPFRAVFEWDKDLVWEKSEVRVPLLVVENTNLIGVGSSQPRLEAKIFNRSQIDESNVEVIALLSDVSGNVVAAGKTFVENLVAGGSLPIVFSWPSAFVMEPVSIRVIPHALPDRSFLR